MTRRHYERTAAALRVEWNRAACGSAARLTVARLAVALADAFAADNPRFDSTRFLEAAGIGYPLSAAIAGTLAVV